MVRLDSGDVVVVIEGLVNLLNSLSNNAIDVGPGQTGISYADGRVFVRDATSNETTNAQRSINAGNGGGRENLLDIELKDDGNNKKRLRIRYKD
jgi:hypothetical protein